MMSGNITIPIVFHENIGKYNKLYVGHVDLFDATKWACLLLVSILIFQEILY